ncbi:GntR family transcriptional regulator [Niallia sp. Krafla_26]|uniref:GntR family transcriptional regulator n=1 Tax=Niallia sp. Krafla_26 TaxID=3064703 RepID=UPI003D1767FF
MTSKSDYKSELSRYSSIPLREAIFQIVKNEIIEGHLLPGDRVTEDDLAKKCNCSRTPVREALRKLEQEGFLVVKPGIGMEIAPINFELLRQEFEIRNFLEEYAVTKACELITVEQLKQLEWTNEKLLYSIENHDYTEGSRLNYEFHQLIYSFTGNTFMKKFSDSLWLSMRISFLSIHGDMGQFNPKWYKDRTYEHVLLVEALRQRDKEKAVSIIKQHIDEHHKHLTTFNNTSIG